MKKEVNDWLQMAISDLDAAKYNLDGKKYKVAAFLSQQTIEKTLKAISIEKTGKFSKVHDLVFLGKSIGLPDNMIDYCKKVTPAYIYTRYPDVVPSHDIGEHAKEFIDYAEEIIKWAENQL
jgi:HEPN domain-containing protein